jgi:hypothetical protein
MSEETVSTGCARMGKTVNDAFGKEKAIEVLVGEDLVCGRRDWGIELSKLGESRGLFMALVVQPEQSLP